MDLDGTNQFINIGVGTVADSTDFTFTAWVNIDDLTAGDPSHAIINCGDNLTPFNGTRLYIKRGSDPGRIGLYDPDAAADDFSASVAVTANQWDLAAIRGTKAVAAGGAVTILGSPAWVNGTTHTAEAGSNRLLVVFAAHRDLTEGVDLDTVTYGTESMTFQTRFEVTTGFVNHIELWYLNEAGIAAASSSTFVFTWNDTATQPIYSSAFFFGLRFVSIN